MIIFSHPDFLWNACRERIANRTNRAMFMFTPYTDSFKHTMKLPAIQHLNVIVAHKMPPFLWQTLTK